MRDTTTESGQQRAAPPASARKRFGWFLLLWAGSLGAWLLIAYGLRSLLTVG